MDAIRVLLAEDHTIVRKGLRSLLDKESGIKVIGEAEDGRDAIKKTEALQPDVVVMDIAMPGLNGLEAGNPTAKETFSRDEIYHPHRACQRRVCVANASGRCFRISGQESSAV